MHQKSQSREIIENKRPLCKVNVSDEQWARVISFVGICKPSFVPLHGFLLLHFSFSLLLKSNALEFVFSGFGSQSSILCPVRIGLALDNRVEGCITIATFA